jgi:toxin ParE1/3/4
VAHKVFLTEGANRDLESIYDYIHEHDTPSNADYVLDQIEEVLTNLESFPERGNYPKELALLGIHEYREVFFKPYRIIYRVLGKSVYILLIADGRRNMQALLQRRLLNG